jgi:hypothetical protein
VREGGASRIELDFRKGGMLTIELTRRSRDYHISPIVERRYGFYNGSLERNGTLAIFEDRNFCRGGGDVRLELSHARFKAVEPK